MPLAGRLVQTADPLDLVPRLVYVRSHQDGLPSVEMDVVIGDRIRGADDESAGQHARLGRLDQELGLQATSANCQGVKKARHISWRPSSTNSPPRIAAVSAEKTHWAAASGAARFTFIASGSAAPWPPAASGMSREADQGNKSKAACSVAEHGRSPQVSCWYAEPIARALPVLGADSARVGRPRHRSTLLVRHCDARNRRTTVSMKKGHPVSFSFGFLGIQSRVGEVGAIAGSYSSISEAVIARITGRTGAC